MRGKLVRFKIDNVIYYGRELYVCKGGFVVRVFCTDGIVRDVFINNIF